MDYGVKKGHLRLASMVDLSEINLDIYDKKLLIVRSVKPTTLLGLEKFGVVHVPQLSPSPGLFSDYINKWKNNVFTQFELDKMSKGLTKSWWDLYTERFLEEMKTRKEIKECLKRTADLLDQGVNVLYICYCPNFNRCHRSILGYVMNQKGYHVIFE